VSIAVALLHPGSVPYPRCRHTATHRVHSLAIALLEYFGVDAQVTSRRERQGQHVGTFGSYTLGPIGNDTFDFFHAFLHLWHGACAVDEFAHFWMCILVGCDKGYKTYRLARTRGHLQQAMSLCVESSLQIQHIVVLFRVEVIIGKEYV